MVHLKLFSIAEVPRADHVRHQLAGRYRDISELWDTRLDGLIVTGTEPRAANLEDEPYWATLAKLVDWARENTVSAIWSCLAAHAAVLHADGIARRPLQEKKFGVFDCEIVSAHPLMAGMPARLRVPHSRYNDLPEAGLTSAGYRLLTRSTAAGVDTFTKQQRSFFLFFQGHPEYEAGYLLREYRRDIGRFLKGEHKHYPAMPQGLFNNGAIAIANEFRERVLGERRDNHIGTFPVGALRAGLETTWRTNAIGIYKRWIGYLRAQGERTNVGSSARWTSRDYSRGRVQSAVDGSTR